MDNEIWKYWKTTTSRFGKRVYYISSLGRIKINGEIQLPHDNGRGYKVIAGEYVHRIVAELFIHNPDNKSCVDHINGDRSDNRACNLRWVTYSENMYNPITNNKLRCSLNGRECPIKGRKWSIEQRENLSRVITKWHANRKALT